MPVELKSVPYNSDVREFKHLTYPFGWAVEMMKQGRRVARKCWDGNGLHLQINDVNAGDKREILACMGDKPLVLWFPRQMDMLANDWIEV